MLKLSKTKLLVPLFVLVLMGLSTSAFAQLTCAVTTPIAVPRGVINGHSETASDLLFTCGAVGAAPTTEATVVISYGMPVTNGTATPATHKVTIASTYGAGVVFDNAYTSTVTTVGTGGLVAFTIPVLANATPAGTITLSNVLLSLSGNVAAGNTVSANISVTSQGNTVTLTGAPIAVIGQALPSVSSTTNPPGFTPTTGPAQFTATGGSISAARNVFSITASENYNDAWRTPGQVYTLANPALAGAFAVAPNGTDVNFVFSGMLPGSLIQNCTPTIAAPGGTGVTLLNLTGSGIASSAGTATLTVELAAGATNTAAIETVTLTCGNATTPAYLVGTSTTPATTPITYAVTQGPIGALSGNLAAIISTPIPRYQTGTQVAGAASVITFSGATTGQTTMIIPWVSASGAAAPPAGTFDTGVVIANTTKGAAPFATVPEGGATAANGSVTFNFFPADGSANFAITPTTGFGLVGGVIPSGSSFIANFSEILKAGNNTSNFSGYVIVVCNFTHAHGSAFLYGGALVNNRIVAAQEVLVISNPGSGSRNTFVATPGLPAAEFTTK